jgi:hypothetical protein
LLGGFVRGFVHRWKKGAWFQGNGEYCLGGLGRPRFQMPQVVVWRWFAFCPSWAEIPKTRLMGTKLKRFVPVVTQTSREFRVRRVSCGDKTPASFDQNGLHSWAGGVHGLLTNGMVGVKSEPIVRIGGGKSVGDFGRGRMNHEATKDTKKGDVGKENSRRR